ncbi:hypothetical protein [Lewinella sp. 4G2]|uniref:hypothetical protein n=1 Tax=Lewinella sp. 4G2 TaxID=1803372 RepID=UPI0007B49E94|nr:hypothetical protein [Lewinella sp. 4G2]OAV43639.1 hypothetical protein A3850_003620 [Lewinella sp. 4G2]
MSRPQLKPGSGLLLEALGRHAAQGFELSVFTAHKLTYFLKQLGGPYGKQVRFSGSPRGPLSPAVDAVLRRLNGSYLRTSLEGPDHLSAPLVLDADHRLITERYVREELSALHQKLPGHLDRLLEDYRDEFGLELLSSVHLVRTFFTQKNVAQIVEITRGWMERPVEEVRTHQVAAAVKRLDDFAGLLAFGG